MASLEATIILLVAVMILIGILIGTLIMYIVIRCRIHHVRTQLRQLGVVAPPYEVDPETDLVTPSAPAAPAEPILAAPTPLGWSH